MNEREIRAVYDDTTITVYQAYNKHIARIAVRNQTFAPPFKMDRMTWIKPSFLWMMYRSGWATKQNQEHVLAIRITREGFDWMVENACLSHYVADIHESLEAWQKELASSPVRVQWDPEKNIHLEKLDYRSIQLGLSGPAVKKYVEEWIVGIEDITARCHAIHALVQAKDLEGAKAMLPEERIYQK